MNKILIIVIVIIPAIVAAIAITNHFWNQYQVDQAHQKDCENAKNIIEIQSQKWTNQLFPNSLNKAIDVYNKECS